MPTPDEFRASLETARADFRAALTEVGGGWEKKPASGEGEDAWSPRQAAEHAIATESYLTTAICTACGYPGVDKVEPNYASADEAVKAFDEVVEMCNKKLKYITDTDLAKSHERFGTVENLLQINIGHMHDHAAQMRSAAGVA